MPETAYALAFDTANEVISIGLGRLNAAACAVEPVAAVEVAAHRASNTQLLVRVDALLREAGVERGQLACVCVGRGPGSFTGVRIAMATAKGAAQALGAALVGVSSLDVVAWHAWASGVRGRLAVVADAMRKEVYPVRYALDDAGVHRLEADRVVKAQVAAQELIDEAPSGAAADVLQLTGDGLAKYAELFAPAGALLPEELWAPTGRGLLLALQDAWRTGAADPLDAQRHNPAFLLPVYTRLSDAEENERIRLAKNDPKNLATGVQDAAPRRDQRATMHDTAVLNARPDEHGITYKPLDAAHAEDVASMESRVMGSDAWNAALVADELPRADRTCVEVAQALEGVREFNRLRFANIDIKEYNFNTLLIDPPRSGLEYKEALDFTARFDRVIYISCGPESLVKDLTYLTKTHKITKIAFFDQFPYTNHLETGVLLEKI